MNFERKITLGVVLAVVVQACGLFMWAGASAQKLKALEVEIEQRRPVAERLARVEARLEHIDSQLDRIEGKMDER